MSGDSTYLGDDTKTNLIENDTNICMNANSGKISESNLEVIDNNETLTSNETATVVRYIDENVKAEQTCSILEVSATNVKEVNTSILESKEDDRIKNVYHCSKCQFSTHKRKKFKAHWKHHNKFHCNICNKKFMQVGTLKRHQLTHKDRKYFLCDLCGRGYLHSISLKYHKLSHLKHNPIAGERTKYIQEKKKRLEDKKEDVVNKYLCDLCGKVFKQAVSLKTHRSKHIEDESGKVTKSGIEVINKTNLSSDFAYEEYLNKKRPGPKRKHPLLAEKKRFKCSECPYAAARSRDVVVHLRTHTGEKPFSCNVCGKFFSKKSVVVRHMLVHMPQNGRLHNRSIDPKDSNDSNKNIMACNEKFKSVPDLYPINKHLYDPRKYVENVRNDKNVEKSFSNDTVNNTNPSIKCENAFMDETKLKYPYFDNSNNIVLVHSANAGYQNYPGDEFIYREQMGMLSKEIAIPNLHNHSQQTNLQNIDSRICDDANISVVKHANKKFENTRNDTKQKGKHKNQLLNCDSDVLSHFNSTDEDRKYLANTQNLFSTSFRQQVDGCGFIQNTNNVVNSTSDNNIDDEKTNVNVSQKDISNNYTRLRGDLVSESNVNEVGWMRSKDLPSSDKFRNNSNLQMDKIMSKENIGYNQVSSIPHVVRIDGRDMQISKREKKVAKSPKEKTETRKRVKGVRMKHKCDQCTYETYLSRDMRVHMRKHSGERPFPCPICGKRFTKESVVKRHQSVHTGLRPFSCEYCYKTFSQQSNLKTHKIAHFDVATGLLKTNIKKYKGKSSSDKMNIRNMMGKNDKEVEFEEQGDVFDMNGDIENADENIADTRLNMEVKKKRNKDRVMEYRKRNKNKDKFEEIETVDVNEILVKSEVDFEFKAEYCSSDDECLSKIKETLMQGIGNEAVEEPLTNTVKEELTEEWQNDENLFDGEFKDEFKENKEKSDNIPNDVNTNSTLSDIKDANKEVMDETEKLERKRRKKMKKKIKRLKQKEVGELKNSCDVEKYDSFVSHRINDGEKTFFKCNECHYSVVNKRDLIVHMRSHSGEKLFSCDICMKKFSKQSVVKRHKLIHFGIRPYTCHLCGLSFTQSNSLKKHIEIKHGVEEKDLPFKCDMCPATFAQEKSLKTHKHVHLRKKNNEFTCHICGKVFPHECRLKSHLLLHDERQYDCSICSKKFLRKYDLKYHMLIHTQEKQCVCHICGGTFSTSATLKMHLRSHSVSHLPCNICGQNFGKPNELLHHKSRVHKIVESFQCTMCDKSFVNEIGLKKHFTVHSSSKQHQCPVCLKRFKHLGHLQKHFVTTNHGIMTTDTFSDAIFNNE